MGFGREDLVRPKKREWGWDSREMKPAHTKKNLMLGAQPNYYGIYWINLDFPLSHL